MHRTAHESLHILSFFGSMVAAVGAMNSEHMQMALGATLAIAGAIWSWVLAQQSKKRDEERRQQQLDADAARASNAADADEHRRQEWAEWQQRFEIAMAEKKAGVEVTPTVEVKP